MQHRLIFGTGSLHHLASPPQRQRAIAAAYDAGFRAFDTAPAYGNGIDEVEIGIALRDRRNDVELNTKFGIPIVTYGAISRYVFAARRLIDQLTGQSARAYRRRDFSPAELEKSLEASLGRLRTDHVDCLFLHEPISRLSSAEIDDIVACGLRMKFEGKIRALGVAGPLSSLALCPSLDGFDVVQTRCADFPHPSLPASDKPLVLYSVHAAFRAARGTDFRHFVRRLLAMREAIRVIVTSRRVETIRSFNRIME
jgi:D-threo-aldose 1-dehydrogenase